jgi:hypothetical protein
MGQAQKFRAKRTMIAAAKLVKRLAALSGD